MARLSPTSASSPGLPRFRIATGSVTEDTLPTSAAAVRQILITGATGLIGKALGVKIGAKDLGAALAPHFDQQPDA